MTLSRKQLLKAMAGAGAAAIVGPQTAHASTGRVIDRDVCVIGGGSAGSYAAARLRDMGRSVVVVERKDRLGGHTETFHDPVTGGTADIGVFGYHDIPIVQRHFGRFDVPVTLSPRPDLSRIRFADHRTGKPVDNFRMPPIDRLSEYLDVLAPYPYLEEGPDLPNPVPRELVAPFSDLMAKHGFADLAPMFYLLSNGRSDLFDIPALYEMKYLNGPAVHAMLTGTTVTTSHRNNSELYEKITTYLGDDVLLNATVTRVNRGRGVLVQVDTPDGPRTIRARRLLVTVPPLPGNLARFDLDSTERTLFGRFSPGGYYTSVLRLPGVPQVPIQNVSADASRHHMPTMPGMYFLAATGIPEIFIAYYGSPRPLPDAQVRADILAAVGRLQSTGVIPATQPRFEMFASHAPFLLSVSPQDIAGGFYRGLSALQGRNNTFYSGAAFHTNDSTFLWRFAESLLPRI